MERQAPFCMGIYYPCERRQLDT